MRRSGVRSPSAPPDLCASRANQTVSLTRHGATLRRAAAPPPLTVQRSIELSQSVNAPPERVWHACSDPAGLCNWQADEVSGRIAPGARVRLRWPALGAAIELDVVEVETGRRLILQTGASRLQLVIEPGRVTLTQDGLTADDEAEGVASAWRASLALLAHHLQHHDGARRRVSWFVRPVLTTAEAAHVFFTERSALRSWLTRSGEVAEQNSQVQLRLAWGEELTGTVLSRTPGRDVALSWIQQAQSVLLLRTLPSPRARDERLVAAVWSHWGPLPALERTEEQLALAVHRLARVLGGSGEA